MRALDMAFFSFCLRKNRFRRMQVPHHDVICAVPMSYIMLYRCINKHDNFDHKKHISTTN